MLLRSTSKFICWVLPRIYTNLPLSYDRAEENELSFREGDRITEIEAASEDWWQGKDKDGNIGLFPGQCFTSSFRELMIHDHRAANYVEVQE